MDSIYEQSKKWIGKFSDYKDIIKNEVFMSVYYEDITKGTINYMSGKQLNELKDTDYCTYDKGIYQNIIFDDNMLYKIREKFLDYECCYKHIFIYIEENKNN